MLTPMNDSTPITPTVEVRDAATLALLRDGDGGLEVLLLRRDPGHVFGANAYVFPGGACDVADRDALTQVCSGAELSDVLYRVAAIRECFEEAGLMVALTGDLPDDPARTDLRDALNTAQLGWHELLARAGMQMRLDDLVAFACWTTPEGAPKRYATRFFAARAPAGQIAKADGTETVSARWVRPAEALVEADTGRRHLMRPTRASLEMLAEFEDTDTALARLATLAGASA